MSTAVDTDWRLRAACADMAVADADAVFFTHDELAVAVALRTCRRCDVRPECLADDLARAGTAEEITGIRAGLRASIRRRMWRTGVPPQDPNGERATDRVAVLAAMQLPHHHLQVLQAMANGAGTRTQVAEQLGIGVHAVGERTKQIRARLRVRSTAEAVEIAARLGLITTTTNRPGRTAP